MELPVIERTQVHPHKLGFPFNATRQPEERSQPTPCGLSIGDPALGDRKASITHPHDQVRQGHHTSSTAFGTARAAANLASDYQRTNPAQSVRLAYISCVEERC
ncbi:MAG: hypothetical protein ACJ788_19265 [Ktedonobacteraceae bacterium]